MESKKIVSSLAFKFTEQILAKVIGLVISILLARLLAPDDFGQVAIITVFINLSQTVIEGGFNRALVQTKELNKADYSTVFYISMAIAILMVLIIYFCAPVIGQFYDSVSLVAPLRFYALSLIFGAFNSIQTAKLQREMRFKATMLARLIATILSGAVGVALAYAGFGIWALVIYNFSFIFLSCITMFIACRWLPNTRFSKDSAKRLFGFGWKILVSSLLCSLYNDVRSLVIGKKYSTEDLGYYNRGEQFPSIISMTLDTAIQSVMLPSMSSVQDKKDEFRALLKKAITFGGFLIIPLMVGLAIVSEPVIRILLTDKWLPAVPFMQFICLGNITVSLRSSNLVAIMAIGKSGLYMKLEIIRRIVMLIILVITVFAFNSIMAIVIGYVVSSIVDMVIILVPTKKLFGYGLLDQIKDLWKILLSSFIMACATYAISFIGLSIWLELIVQIVVAFAVYFVACYLLKEKSLFLIKKIVQKFFRKKKA